MLGWLLGLAAATGQEKKAGPEESQKDGPAEFREEGKAGRDPIVRLRLETWEASALEVAKHLDEVKNAEDVAKLRGEWLAGPPAVSLVLSSAINVSPPTSSPPTRVLAKSVTELIYPTEYEPPSLPCYLPKEEKSPVTGLEWLGEVATKGVPSSFETRNTGTTVQAEVIRISKEKKTWEANIEMDDVRYLGKESYGPEELVLTMPVFSSFHTSSSLRLKDGQWQILSVMEPPRGLDSKPSDKRWVTLVRLDQQE